MISADGIIILHPWLRVPSESEERIETTTYQVVLRLNLACWFRPRALNQRYCLHHIVLFYQSSLFKARQVEHRDIHRGKFSVDDIFTHQFACDGSMHETVTGKA